MENGEFLFAIKQLFAWVMIEMERLQEWVPGFLSCDFEALGLFSLFISCKLRLLRIH
jgi:hypothetical protein